MYVSEMMELLDTRLEDPGRTKYLEVSRLRALRNAELTLIANLHNAYFTELETSSLSVAASGGKIALTSLPDIAVRGKKGIVKCRVHGGKWATEIEFRDVKRQESNLYKGSLINPQYYVYANEIVFDPATITLADVYYIRLPEPLLGSLTIDPGMYTTLDTFSGDDQQGLNDTINNYYQNTVIRLDRAGVVSYHIVTLYDATALSFTVVPAIPSSATFLGATFNFIADPFTVTALDGVQSELNPSLHELMVTLAEADCLESEKMDRKISTSKMAFAEIAVLNARYEAAEGVGTGRGR